MLTYLSIKNLGLIRQVELDLPAQLITITGETGAGKSMLLKALSLLSGQRASDKIVGQDADKAEISACFTINNNAPAKTWSKERELYVDDLHPDDACVDDQCIIRRIINQHGPGKQYINQTPVNLKSLKQLADLLLDVHFQQQHQSLLQQDHQQIFFDTYAGLDQKVKTLAKCYKTWKSLENERRDQQQKQGHKHYQNELLQHQFAELDQLELTEHSITQLEKRHKELSFAQTLMEHSQKALDLLSSDGALAGADTPVDTLTQVRKAAQLIEKMRDKTELDDLTGLLATIIIDLEEVVAGLARKISNFEDDPETLLQLDQQIEQLHQLARKHRVSIHELPRIHQQLQEQLTQSNDLENNIRQLTQQIKARETEYHLMAATISHTRHKQGPKLSQEINFYLKKIGLAETQFEVKITAKAEPGIHGSENIGFWLSTNPGQPLRPLEEVASGGELSRISLALQMLKAKVSNIPVLVFDEIDVGIGGAIAATVGKMLRSIAQKGQVLCITHQAQVAAYGNHHLLVKKETKAGINHSFFYWLKDEARIQELARMISGITMNKTTVEHATNLLKSTRED